jgi:hypothetical protein
MMFDMIKESIHNEPDNWTVVDGWMLFNEDRNIRLFLASGRWDYKGQSMGSVVLDGKDICSDLSFWQVCKLKALIGKMGELKVIKRLEEVV